MKKSSDDNLKPPRIKNIYINNFIFYILFYNNKIKKYDVGSLLDKEYFKSMKNHSYLKTAKIDIGGYGISWDDDCDKSENELWTKGEIIHDILELERIKLILEGDLKERN
jgi:hypothetical protein